METILQKCPYNGNGYCNRFSHPMPPDGELGSWCVKCIPNKAKFRDMLEKFFCNGPDACPDFSQELQQRLLKDVYPALEATYQENVKKKREPLLRALSPNQALKTAAARAGATPYTITVSPEHIVSLREKLAQLFPTESPFFVEVRSFAQIRDSGRLFSAFLNSILRLVKENRLRLRSLFRETLPEVTHIIYRQGLDNYMISWEEFVSVDLRQYARNTRKRLSGQAIIQADSSLRPFVRDVPLKPEHLDTLHEVLRKVFPAGGVVRKELDRYRKIDPERCTSCQRGRIRRAIFVGFAQEWEALPEEKQQLLQRVFSKINASISKFPVVENKRIVFKSLQKNE